MFLGQALQAASFDDQHRIKEAFPEFFDKFNKAQHEFLEDEDI
jgi:hypothetical protein